MEELSNGDDVHMGISHDTQLFDGDSIASDDEAVGSSVWLEKGLLEADAQISRQQDTPEEMEETAGDLKLNSVKPEIERKTKR